MIVYAIEWEDIECGGFHSVHKTLEGAEAEIKKAKLNDRFSSYEIKEVELQD